MRSISIKVFIAAVCALTMISITPALAHTALLSSTPGNNAIIQVSPKSFVLKFSEALATIDGKKINSITITGPAKNRVKLRAVQIGKSTLSTTPIEPLAIGRYEMKYRVVAKDGHALNGTLHFTIK